MISFFDMIYQRILTEAAAQLEAAQIPDPEVDAWELFEEAFSINRKDYLLLMREEADKEGVIRYRNLLERRKKREPLQQILGHTGFMGLDFVVTGAVLSPRQDTECLVERASEHLKKEMSLLDLCTGSGCILISLMHMGENIQGFGVDISEEAIKVARINAERNYVHPRLLCGDLFEPVGDMRFDMIVSNPPYIKSDVIPSLMPEVKDYEPLSALDGSADGLLFYRRIIEGASAHLNDGGIILFETGVDQRQDVSSLLFDAGFSDIRSYRDYSHNDRVVSARYMQGV